MKKNILIVDDDQSICKLLQSALTKNSFNTNICFDGESALQTLNNYSVDAVILDIMLPGIDGLELLKTIRQNYKLMHIPVIMLTSKDSEVEAVLGLELGADDYLSKPVRYHELITRLKKLLAKNETSVPLKNDIISIHSIDINKTSRATIINGVNLTLTFLEFELLALFASNPGKVFTRDNLLDSLWHEDQFNETRTVDVHIRRLRKKIEGTGIDPNIIETIRSVGYRMKQA